jgi:hypothetical protein
LHFCFILNSSFLTDKFRGFAFITFDDYDSVDCCILEKPHIINGKELDVRKAIPREQTSRINGFILHNNNNNHHLNTDFYQTQNRYQPHLMINHPTLPPTLYPPYAYFPSSNYLSKPIPLMGTTNPCSQSGALPPQTFILPPDLANSAFFRNQTFPSPPPSTSSLARTNNNSTQYQNGNNNNKSNNDPPLASNDSSKPQQLNTNYSTPFRSKPR